MQLMTSKFCNVFVVHHFVKHLHELFVTVHKTHIYYGSLNFNPGTNDLLIHNCYFSVVVFLCLLNVISKSKKKLMKKFFTIFFSF